VLVKNSAAIGPIVNLGPENRSACGKDQDLHTKFLLDLPANPAADAAKQQIPSADSTFQMKFSTPGGSLKKKKEKKKKDENFTSLRILKRLCHTRRIETTYCEFEYPSGIILASSRYPFSTSHGGVMNLIFNFGMAVIFN